MPPQESNQASNQPTNEPVVPASPATTAPVDSPSPAPVPVPQEAPSSTEPVEPNPVVSPSVEPKFTPPVATAALPTDSSSPAPSSNPPATPPPVSSGKTSHTLPILLSILLILAIAAGGYAYYKWGMTEAEEPIVVITPMATEEEKKVVEPVPKVSSPVVLTEKGLGIVSFGSSTQETIAKVSAVYGSSTLDTGWTNSFSVYGTCPGKQIRVVEWGRLRVFFGDTIFGKQKFFHYEYAANGSSTEVGSITTENGLTIGVSADLLKNLYPNITLTTDQNSVTWFALAENASTTASFLGTTDNGKVAYIGGGIHCGE